CARSHYGENYYAMDYW
nr:immunoglobulin heavy chain junction region [Mus musculus]